MLLYARKIVQVILSESDAKCHQFNQNVLTYWLFDFQVFYTNFSQVHQFVAHKTFRYSRLRNREKGKPNQSFEM